MTGIISLKANEEMFGSLDGEILGLNILYKHEHVVSFSLASKFS